MTGVNHTTHVTQSLDSDNDTALKLDSKCGTVFYDQAVIIFCGKLD